MGCEDIPISTALKKIDRLSEVEAVRTALSQLSRSVASSAKTGEGLP